MIKKMLLLLLTLLLLLPLTACSDPEIIVVSIDDSKEIAPLYLVKYSITGDLAAADAHFGKQLGFTIPYEGYTYTNDPDAWEKPVSSNGFQIEFALEETYGISVKRQGSFCQIHYYEDPALINDRIAERKKDLAKPIERMIEVSAERVTILYQC